MFVIVLYVMIGYVWMVFVYLVGEVCFIDMVIFVEMGLWFLMVIVIMLNFVCKSVIKVYMLGLK